MPKGVDKAASLAKLCEILGRSRDDMIACGDGFNDISMIEFAGLGVAMENAQEPVKKSQIISQGPMKKMVLHM